MREAQTSPWVLPGWFGAVCVGCPSNSFSPGFRTAAERDRWADDHEAETGHVPTRLDGETTKSGRKKRSTVVRAE